MHRIQTPRHASKSVEAAAPPRLERGGGRLPTLLAGLLVLVLIGRLQELFPVLLPLRLGLVTLVLNALALLATLDLRDLAFKMRILPQPKQVLVILALAVITVPFSVWPGGSWEFISDTFVKNVFAFFVLVHVMKDERDIKVVVWAALWSVALLGILGLLEHAGGRMRISSTYDPNDVAYIMNCFIPLAFYLSRSCGTILKLLCYILMGVLIVAVISTASRGGFVGLVSIFLVILLKERRNKLKILLLAAFVGLVALSFSGPAYWERMGTILDENDYNYQAGSGRIELWKRGVRMMVDNPLIGAGIGQYNVAEGLLHEGERGWKWSVAHNSYLQIGVELGFPGLILFLLMIAKSIVVARKLQASPGPFEASAFLAATSSGLEVGLYGYCVSGVFLSQAYSPVLLYFLSLATALYAVSFRMGEATVPAVRERKPETTAPAGRPRKTHHAETVGGQVW